MPGSCATAGTRSSSWRSTRRSSRPPTSSSTGSLPSADRAVELRGAHPPAHDAPRGPQGLLPGLPSRRPPDAGAVLRGLGAVDLLPGQPRPLRPAAGRDLDDPPARQAADHRGVRVQEVDRPAVPLPGQQPHPRRELPADDVRRARRPTTRSTPTWSRRVDLLLVLHADHEQNCSTSTVRLVGSSQANLFASVSAGINALFGPLHGGANQAVLEMLERIQQAATTPPTSSWPRSRTR